MGVNGTASTVDWPRYKTIRLETRKRDGTWVATPVSLVVRDGRLFFRTYKQSGKAKRLRNFSAVRVARRAASSGSRRVTPCRARRVCSTSRSPRRRADCSDGGIRSAWRARAARAPGHAIRHPALRADRCRSGLTARPAPGCSRWRASCSGGRGTRRPRSRRSRRRRVCRPGSGGLYRHFPSKKALLEASLRQQVDSGPDLAHS